MVLAGFFFFFFFKSLFQSKKRNIVDVGDSIKKMAPWCEFKDCSVLAEKYSELDYNLHGKSFSTVMRIHYNINTRSYLVPVFCCNGYIKKNRPVPCGLTADYLRPHPP